MKKPTLFNSSRRKPKSLDQSLGPLVSRYLLPPGTPKWVVRAMLRNSGPLGLLMGPTLLIFLSVFSLAQFKVRGERGSRGACAPVVSFADDAHWRPMWPIAQVAYAFLERTINSHHALLEAAQPGRFLGVLGAMP